MTIPPIPDPEPSPQPGDHPIPPQPPRRIPNFGHALLFVGIVGLLLFIAEVILALAHKLPVKVHGATVTVLHPALQLAMMTGIYLVTLVLAWIVFPHIWHRPFPDGLQWHVSTARAQLRRLVALGFALAVIMAAFTALINSKQSLPIDEFFLKPSSAWLITFFGIFVAPPFEEICFRGFLLPAFAIAYDWIALPRTPQDRQRWHSTTTLTPASLLFSAILTSILFALLHAQQDAHLWFALLGLFCVSLVLCWVRIRTQSVAASALVHASYNAFIFLVTIIASGGYRHLDRLSH